MHDRLRPLVAVRLVRADVHDEGPEDEVEPAEGALPPGTARRRRGCSDQNTVSSYFSVYFRVFL